MIVIVEAAIETTKVVLDRLLTIREHIIVNAYKRLFSIIDQIYSLPYISKLVPSVNEVLRR